MKRLHFTRLAVNDLDEIHDYIAENNPIRARRFIDRLEKKANVLQRVPELANGAKSLAQVCEALQRAYI